MKHYTGRVLELFLEAYKNANARILLPKEAPPKPGQFLQANSLAEDEELLPVTIFPASLPILENGDWTINVVGNLPDHWTVGSEIALNQAKGSPFHLPKGTKHVALYPLGKSVARLLPLMQIAKESDVEITLLSDESIEQIPIAVEIQPLSALNHVIEWADFLILDIPLNNFNDFSENGKLAFSNQLTGQAILSGDYPCGAIAQCGLCSFQSSTGQKFACHDGPVFDLNDIL